jgi:hypothetical protein
MRKITGKDLWFELDRYAAYGSFFAQLQAVAEVEPLNGDALNNIN